MGPSLSLSLCGPPGLWNELAIKRLALYGAVQTPKASNLHFIISHCNKENRFKREAVLLCDQLRDVTKYCSSEQGLGSQNVWAPLVVLPLKAVWPWTSHSTSLFTSAFSSVKWGGGGGWAHPSFGTVRGLKNELIFVKCLEQHKTQSTHEFSTNIETY